MSAPLVHGTPTAATEDGPASVHENSHPQGLSSGGTASSSGMAQSSSSIISFSWSDFPLLGGGPEDITAPLPELMEETWSSTSCSSSETASDTSSDASTITPLLAEEEEEEDVAVPLVNSKPRRVRFSKILCIRTLPVTLGDHPFCVGGLALTCDWSPDNDDDEECIDLDVYERFTQRRTAAELRMPYHERRDRLVAATGWTTAELLQREYALLCQPHDPPKWCPLRPTTSCQGSLDALDGW